MTVRALPRSLEDLRGRRAARWIRESTAGQVDSYGPDAQREQQDRAPSRAGAWSTPGCAWSVGALRGARSSAAARWAAMLDGARRRSVRRPGRRLRRPLAAQPAPDAQPPRGRPAPRRRRGLVRRRGVLSSRRARLGPAGRRGEGRRVVAAEASPAGPGGLRREARDGARPGRRGRRSGFRREPDDEARRAGPRSTAPSSAAPSSSPPSGLTDREVARGDGARRSFTVRGMLTSPFYVGRLRTGERAHWAPSSTPRLWEAVQAIRASAGTPRRHAPRGPPAPYALTMLHCAACGRHLIGDTGRYRHPDACEAFTAVRREPRTSATAASATAHARAQSTGSTSTRRSSARSSSDVSLGADRIAAVVAARPATPSPTGSPWRGSAGSGTARWPRYRRDRDLGPLEATMARARRAGGEAGGRRGRPQASRPPPRPSPTCETCRTCGTTAPDARPRALAEAAVRADRGPGAATDAPLSRHAKARSAAGLVEAFVARNMLVMVGARGFEPPTSSSRTMRATKLRHAPTESAR